jgi:hypothetical protein
LSNSKIPNTFPIARYCFEFEVLEPIKLPEYSGSTLRGSFGHALRQLSCVTRAKTCLDCLLIQTCPYTRIFEPPPATFFSLATPPVPYIIEPPDWGVREYLPGEIILFNFILMGRELKQFPLTLMAWQRAFARGVGPARGKAQLVSVKHENKIIYQPGISVIEHNQYISLDNIKAPKSVTLEFITPLRLQVNGKATPPSRLNVRALLTSLMRRASVLAGYDKTIDFSNVASLAEEVQSEVNMQWRDWTRRSSRQKSTMQLGGCIGNWTLTGDLDPFWDYLQLGVYLHAGKEASFGLGQYKIIQNDIL